MTSIACVVVSEDENDTIIIPSPSIPDNMETMSSPTPYDILDAAQIPLHHTLQPCRKRAKIADQIDYCSSAIPLCSLPQQIPMQQPILNRAVLDELEKQRQQLQWELDKQTNLDYRNRHGQYATPPNMAMDVAQVTLQFYRQHIIEDSYSPSSSSSSASYPHNNTPLCVVDPSCGTGSLLLAMMRTLSNEPTPAPTINTTTDSSFGSTTTCPLHLGPLCCIGYEKDENVWRRTTALFHGSSSPTPVPRLPIYMHHQDFTTLTPAAANHMNSDSTRAITTTAVAADIVLANPPYVRHRHMSLEEKTRLQALSKTYSGGIQCNKMAGLHCYFMLMMHAHMKPNAIAAWIIPGEFIAVSYASAMRLYLCNKVILLRIHGFAAIDQQFADAQVSTSIVWYLNRPLSEAEQKSHVVQITMGKSVIEPDVRRHVPWHLFHETAQDKWNHIFTITAEHGSQSLSSSAINANTTVPIQSHSTGPYHDTPTYWTDAAANYHVASSNFVTDNNNNTQHYYTSETDRSTNASSSSSWQDMMIDPDMLIMDSTHMVPEIVKPPILSLSSSAETTLPTIEVLISDVFTVKRGIATGYDEFFIMSMEQAVNMHQLPLDCLTHLLPNSSEMPPTQSIQPEDPSMRCVVNCDLTMEEIQSKYPTLFIYLQYGETKLNVPSRYLCKKRLPRWYRQEARTPPPIVVTARGRISKTQANPFRFFRNHDPRAIASSHYLQLNLKEPYASIITDRKDIDTLWKCLQQIPVDAILTHARAYGGGLYDLKPSDLNRVRFKIPKSMYNTCHATAAL